MTDLKSRVRVPEDVLFCDLGEEAVVMSQRHGQYYGLDEVGARIWSLLTEHGRLETVSELLCAEYDADPETLSSDLLKFVHTMEGYHLLEVDIPKQA